jgi:hypothetical protein
MPPYLRKPQNIDAVLAYAYIIGPKPLRVSDPAYTAQIARRMQASCGWTTRRTYRVVQAMISHGYLVPASAREGHPLAHLAHFRPSRKARARIAELIADGAMMEGTPARGDATTVHRTAPDGR